MLLIFIGIVILFGSLIIGLKFGRDLRIARERLYNYHASQMDLSCGKIQYLDRGTGDTILISHGLFGGFDQGYESFKNLGGYRFIAPSRFGYLNSDVLGEGTPKDQCRAYIELLDRLKIDRVFIAGTSAGGTVAIRFALDYPERCKGLILYSSAMPEAKKPNKINLHQAPPYFLCNDLAMYLLTPVFKSILGMDGSVVKTMLPIKEKRAGIKIDGGITNPDMAVNYEKYDIESIRVPTLILQAKDDKLAKYEKFAESSKRFKYSTIKVFETGGHLLSGHEQEGRKIVLNFISMNSTLK